MTPLTSPQLAVNGGTPVRQRPWPAWPVWDEADAQALAEVVRSGEWFSMSGRGVHAFAGVTTTVGFALSGGASGTIVTPDGFPNIDFGSSVSCALSSPYVTTTLE